MKTLLAIVLAAGVLAGCATGPAEVHRELTVTPADGSSPGHFRFPLGVNAGLMDLELGGRRFSGEWIYVADGGQVGRAAMVVPTAAGPRLITSTQRAGSTSGTVRFNLRSEGAALLQCGVGFSFDSGTGAGDCSDSAGRRYTVMMFTVGGP